MKVTRGAQASWGHSDTALRPMPVDPQPSPLGVSMRGYASPRRPPTRSFPAVMAAPAAAAAAELTEVPARPRGWRGSVMNQLIGVLGRGHVGQHRFAVVGVGGGVGTSTLVALLAEVTAVASPRSTVAVDATGALWSPLVSRLLEGEPAATIGDVTGRRDDEAGAPAGIRQGAAGVFVLPCRQGVDGPVPRLLDDAVPWLMAALEPCGATVWDLPPLPSFRAVGVAAGDSDLVLVGRGTCVGVEQVLGALALLRCYGWHDLVTRARVVLMHTSAVKDRSLPAARRHLDGQVGGVSELRYEPGLATGGLLRPAVLSRPVVETAAQIVVSALTSRPATPAGTPPGKDSPMIKETIALAHAYSVPRAAGGGVDYTKFKPDQKAVPRSDLFTLIMDGLMWVGFIVVGFAAILGVITWMVGDKIGGHHLSAEGKGNIFKALVGGAALGSFGAIMNFVVNA